MKPGPPRYRIYGLKRAGNHALLPWIAHQFDQPVLFLNDVLPTRDPLDKEVWIGKTRTYDLPKYRRQLRDMNCVDIWKHNLKDIREMQVPTIISYEDYDFTQGPACPGDLPRAREIPLVLLRDPFNWLASRIKKLRTNREITADDAVQLIEIWKKYGQEVFGETNYLDGIGIRFGKLIENEDYRNEIRSELGLSGGDSGLKIRGSRGSFQRQENLDPNQLDLFSRWQHLREENWVDKILDPQLLGFADKMSPPGPPGSEVERVLSDNLTKSVDRPREFSKIFGIGLSRTGTTSLSEGLGILGYDVPTNPVAKGAPSLWYPFSKGNFRPRHLQEADGWTDMPVPLYWHRLSEAWPKSKFILTVRPIKGWLDSMKYVFSEDQGSPDYPLKKFTQGASFGLLEFDRKHLKWFYQSHVKLVKNFFGKDRLLVLDITEENKWASLCGFLGRKIPDRPFPHAHGRRKN